MHWMTAAELALGYRKKTFSPVEVTKHLLARIDALNPRCHAFIEVDHEGALAAARQAEHEISAGRALGPLHGVPIGIKDIIDIAGQTTTCHSNIMLKHQASEDAQVIRKLRAAGVIFMGKLALHEFAIGGPAFDLPFPPARNPWNLAHHPGGSSSGSGAALAAGLVPLALGTDTGGSIRNPAACCGIVGLKATYELVSRRGVFTLSSTMDHVGPMARTVQDTGLLLNAMAEPQGDHVAPDYVADVQRGIKGLRIGYVRHFHETDEIAHPEVAAALDQAAKVLSSLGASVTDVKLPALNDFLVSQKFLMMAEGWAVHEKWLRERPEDYSQTSRRKLLTGALVTGGEYVQSMQRRGMLIDAVDRLFNDYDVLLVANSMDPACRIDDEAEVVRTYTRQARMPFNLTGHPALALMTGQSSGGLPLSMQLVGKSFNEKMVLRVGAAYEQATQWHTKRPTF
jgi:aspartyl-tRNA(Asn)/glutamyl-tRNA(Gln) amidotransferase subunit A